MDSQCEEWQGVRNPQGYGMTGPKQHTLAHRAAWEVANGSIPEGLCVLHHCDNPPCCNVDHLYLGTRADNARDRVARGRTARGERNGHAKLSDREVREIRLLCDQGWRHRDIAASYGVAHYAIGRIGRRVGWTHVPEQRRRGFPSIPPI